MNPSESTGATPYYRPPTHAVCVDLRPFRHHAPADPDAGFPQPGRPAGPGPDDGPSGDLHGGAGLPGDGPSGGLRDDLRGDDPRGGVLPGYGRSGDGQFRDGPPDGSLSGSGLPGRGPSLAAVEAVRAALDAPQRGDERRFLVVDDATRLVAHQLLYEQLHAYGPAQVVCLAVGSPEDRVLRRPLTLRPPAAGVLWLPDPRIDADADAYGDALRPLVELLTAPEVFDAVLGALGNVVHGVAVPAVRVVEHDLTDEGRTRAWKQAVDSLTGQDVPGTGPGDGVPAELAVLLDDSVPSGLESHPWLVPNGPADLRHRACDDALAEVCDAHRRIRGAAGLFGTAGTRRLDLPSRLWDLGQALGRYRDTVAAAFDDGGGGGGGRLTPDRRARLLERGIQLPEPSEASRTRVVPALRDFTQGLLARRLPLRSAASRLAALSGRSAPAGSAVRLARLDELCPPAYLRHLERPPAFVAGGTPAVGAVLAAAPAFVAGLWPGSGWALGPATGLLAGGLALLMRRHRPNRSPDGRLDGDAVTGAGPRFAGGLVGGLLGASAGLALGLPGWAGLCLALLAVAAVVLVAVRDWTLAVDDWWRRTDAEYAGRVVTGTDRLLAETAVHDWLFADARHHCSDAAGAVAVLLRGMAATAEAYEAYAPGPDGASRPQEPAAPPLPPPGEDGGAAEPWGWDTWSDSSAGDGWYDAVPAGATPYAEPVAAPLESLAVEEWRPVVSDDPPWLERERGDGGPDLVDTLVADLLAGTGRILTPCWARVERDPVRAGRIPLDGPMHDVLDEVHGRLLRDAATSPSPYDRHPEQRPDAARLTGVAPDRIAEVLAPENGADRTVPLCGPQHRRLLSHDPVAVRRVRFVPEAFRRGTGADDPRGDHHGAHRTLAEYADEVVWTPAGRHAGVLDLVPLRTDAVRTVREEGGAA